MSSRRKGRALNPEQELAAAHLEGPALVLAGPGTGKTTTLVGRYANLIRRGVDPSKIFVATFTRKAAEELKARIRDKADVPVRGRPIGTFHSYCFHLLGRPAVIEESRQYAILRKCLKGYNGDLQAVLEGIARYKDSLVSPLEALKRSRAVKSPDRADAEFLAAAYSAYQEAMQSAGLHDFGDLITLAIDNLRSQEQGGARPAFDFLLIDEYQDINPAQDVLITQLLAGGQNLWVVGDDDQAIYGWRGSDVRYITGFTKTYKSASVYKLKSNYRSTPLIVRATQELIEHNRNRLPKRLEAHSGKSLPICLSQTSDEVHEARWVIGAVAKLLEARVPHSEIAILLRTNFQTVEFEAECERSGIPFVIRGGEGFWSLPVVRALMAAVWRSDPDRAGVEPPWAGPQYLAEMLDECVTRVPGPSFVSIIQDLVEVAVRAVPRSASSERQVQWTGGARRFGEEGQRIAERGAFLEHCVAAAKNRPEDDGNAIVLSTIHQAKGLEWDAVFLCGCEAGLLPHPNAEDHEEERRLAYVAATRAKRFLTVSWATRRGGKKSAPSPLVRELTSRIPPEQLDRRGHTAEGHRGRSGGAGASGRVAPSREPKVIRVTHSEYGDGTLKTIVGGMWVVAFDDLGEIKVSSRSVRLAK